MKLTLTFDNGPDPVVTSRVLDILRARSLRAHFFVLGKLVATPEGRALVERQIAEGHLVGNHSYTHETPLGDDARPDAVEREIVATQALLDPLLKDTPRRFRPFGGGGLIGDHLLSPTALRHLQAHAYTCVTWNAVPRDWVDEDTWGAAALASIDKAEHVVLVLHDVEKACLLGLDDFLGAALDRGAQITLDLPLSCTPLVGGHATTDLAPLVRGGIS